MIKCLATYVNYSKKLYKNDQVSIIYNDKELKENGVYDILLLNYTFNGDS